MNFFEYADKHPVMTLIYMALICFTLVASLEVFPWRSRR